MLQRVLNLLNKTKITTEKCLKKTANTKNRHYNRRRLNKNFVFSFIYYSHKNSRTHAHTYIYKRVAPLYI